MRRLAIALVGAMIVAACGSSATPPPPIGASPTPSPTDILAPTDEPTVEPTPQDTLQPTEEPEVTPAPTKAATTKYKVKKGDTLYKIAKKYKITVEALQKANPKVKATNLKVGQVLVIPKK